MKRSAGFPLLFIFFIISGCSTKKPVSPMEKEVIPFSKSLHVGIYETEGDHLFQAMQACSSRFLKYYPMERAQVVRVLRDQGLPSEPFLDSAKEWKDFENIQGLHLLLVRYSEGQKSYLRIVNYLAKYVSTVSLTQIPSCEDLLRATRIVYFQSHPPFADVYVDRRMIGEAPFWAWLRDGDYQIDCRLPGEVFPMQSLSVPQNIEILCQRNAVSGDPARVEEGSLETERNIDGIILYLLVGAGVVGAILFPFLLFL